MPKDLIITNHARVRYVQRIRQPIHYKHLLNCNKNCAECAKLEDDSKAVVRNFAPKIDWEIVTLFKEAKKQNWTIKDVSFLEAILKKYGENSNKDKFYRNGDAILVVTEDDNNEFNSSFPTLVTVLNIQMIDGTTIDAFAGTKQMDNVFKRWKFQARQRR